MSSYGNILLDINFLLSKIAITENMKVADLGCGSTGYFVFPTARIVGKHGKVYAVDILKTALETINRKTKQENLDNIQTVWSDLEIFNATKIESASIDVAFLINTLYQSHKRAEILREANRLLKKGGRLLVVEWNNMTSPFGPPADERVQIDLLKITANKLGLQTENEFNAGQYHYGIIFMKM